VFGDIGKDGDDEELKSLFMFDDKVSASKAKFGQQARLQAIKKRYTHLFFKPSEIVEPCLIKLSLLIR
jgi:hypothetical protein